MLAILSFSIQCIDTLIFDIMQQNRIKNISHIMSQNFMLFVTLILSHKVVPCTYRNYDNNFNVILTLWLPTLRTSVKEGRVTGVLTYWRDLMAGFIEKNKLCVYLCLR